MIILLGMLEIATCIKPSSHKELACYAQCVFIVHIWFHQPQSFIRGVAETDKILFVAVPANWNVSLL